MEGCEWMKYDPTAVCGDVCCCLSDIESKRPVEKYESRVSAGRSYLYTSPLITTISIFIWCASVQELFVEIVAVCMIIFSDQIICRRKMHRSV